MAAKKHLCRMWRRQTFGHWLSIWISSDLQNKKGNLQHHKNQSLNHQYWYLDYQLSILIYLISYHGLQNDWRRLRQADISANSNTVWNVMMRKRKILQILHLPPAIKNTSNTFNLYGINASFLNMKLWDMSLVEAHAVTWLPTWNALIHVTFFNNYLQPCIRIDKLEPWK